MTQGAQGPFSDKHLLIHKFTNCVIFLFLFDAQGMIVPKINIQPIGLALLKLSQFLLAGLPTTFAGPLRLNTPYLLVKI